MVDKKKDEPEKDETPPLTQVNGDMARTILQFMLTPDADINWKQASGQHVMVLQTLNAISQEQPPAQGG